jgi:hypothetical protein
MSRQQWNVGFRTDSGPSRGNLGRPAFRPSFPSRDPVCYDRLTSKPVKLIGSWAALLKRRGPEGCRRTAYDFGGRQNAVEVSEAKSSVLNPAEAVCATAGRITLHRAASAARRSTRLDGSPERSKADRH